MGISVTRFTRLRTTVCLWLVGVGLGCGPTEAPKPEAVTEVRSALLMTEADCPPNTAGHHILGGPGNDTLKGTGADECILGLGGNDVITGGGGKDTLIGGAGNDQIKGSAGNDQIFGEDGDDRLEGNGGTDTLVGGDGDDVLIGGAGPDNLQGGNGNDQIAAGGGKDVISGGAGNDIIDGEAGDDTIAGDDGDDLIENVAGDNINGGAGTDACQGPGSNVLCELPAPANCTRDAGCGTGRFCQLTTGTCVGCLTSAQCNDNTACTTDVCAGGTCTHPSTVICPAPDQCHLAGVCNPTTGVCSNQNKPNGSACSDGNACTQTDTCQTGACVGANPVVCAGPDQCHVAGVCNPSSGVCSNPNKPDGSACSDANACTQTDTCQAGACVGANPVVCAASDQCHVAGACNPTTGVCSNPNAPDGTSCNDTNACTQADACTDGACAGVVVDSDGDGIPDCTDPCPHDAANDADDDGFCADVDNCPTTANITQQDTNGDGRGDACNGPAQGAIAAGSGHTCAIREGGKVYCWGLNGEGQLGTGSMSPASLVPVQVTGLNDAVALAAGPYHTCALRPSGQVVCWGRGSSGQLGDGSFVTGAPTPVTVSGLSDAVKIAAGEYHTCALRATGAVACWGNGGSGQLGNGLNTPQPTPVAVSGLSDAVALTAGSLHSCAVRATGQVTCWGYGYYGQLGNGTLFSSSNLPVPVATLVDAVALAAGVFHTCAVRASGEVSCWGRGTEGQLGNGTFSFQVSTPAAVTGLSDAVAVTARASHTCVTRRSGEVSCWGRGTEGQLGNGATTTTTTPVVVFDLWDARAAAAGDAHTCALRANDEVVCWGGNNNGLLGTGGTTPSPVPRTTLAGSATVCPTPRSSADLPDAAFTDSNGDGIDGDLASAYFVSVTGSDSNRGTRQAPFRTIRHAIETSASHPCRYQVLVSAGTYAETVPLASGVSLWGQYDPVTWARSAANTTTIASPGNVGIVVTEYAAEGYIEGFTVSASTGTVPGTSTRALLLRDVTAPLHVRGNRLVGADGAVGLSVGSALAGYQCGGSPGLGGCNGFCTSNGERGQAGCSGAPGGGGGLVFGGWGEPGSNVSNPGSPGSIPWAQGIGGFLGTNWVALAGGAGDPGLTGGGGGGGASGLCFCGGGTAGGRGGLGGYGGGGGKPGGGAGGSFAIVAIRAAAAVVTGNELVTGLGGVGGSGSPGGAGGPGQSGSAGDACCGIPGAPGSGGNGASGGNGSPGGPGAGGGGGMSVGILLLDSAGIVLAGNTYTIGGAGPGGPGGPGGAPNGDPGITAEVFTMPSTGSVNISNAQVVEGNAGDTLLAFTISLGSPSSQDVTVSYATGDGTAQAGADYATVNNGVVTFSPGETAKQVNVSVTGDLLVETDETLTVTLSNPINAFIGVGQGVGTIIDDDLLGAGADADYCTVQFPHSFAVQAGAVTPSIYGQLYEAGLTETPDPAPGVTAEVGFGALGSQPWLAGWTWSPAAWNIQAGNNDEYVASFMAPSPGDYSYVYRFSLSGGSGWTYCDGNGSGSNAGLSFDVADMPVMSVMP